MNRNLTPNATLVATPEAPAKEVSGPVRGRNAKMDQFLRAVNGSHRFAFDAVAVAVAVAVEAVMKKAKA